MLSCSECGKPIPLLLEKIALAFQTLDIHNKEREFVAAVCDHCRRIEIYDLEKTKPNPPVGQVASLPETSEWVYLGSLECEDNTCKPRPPLFAKRNPATSPVEWKAYVDTWKWDGLVCPNRHPIPMPD